MEFIGISSIFSFMSEVLTLPDWSGVLDEVGLNFIAKFIALLNGAIKNYGLTVILFTVILKVLTFPLDVWQRVLAKKNAVITKELGPLMANIDKQFPNDKQAQAAEKQKVMKKMGYSPASSCLPLIVTLVVFSIMFSGLNSYSAYVNVENYVKLEAEYIETYNGVIENADADADAAVVMATAEEEAQKAVGIYFKEEVQESFLWINNIWRPDTWETLMVEAEAFQSGGSGLKAITNIPAAAQPFEGRYEDIREGVLEYNPGYFAKYEKDADGNVVLDADGNKVLAKDSDGNLVNSGWNGLILMPVLAMGIMFLSSWISQKQNNPGGANKNDPSQQSAKMMMFMMPIMFGIFGFFYTAAFSVYLVSNSFISIIVNLVTTPWINNLAQKSLSKKKVIEQKASYKR